MKDILQKALVEHYVNSKGLITEQDVDETVFQKWIALTNTLYNQALELNRRDWDNPTELKEYSIHDPIWDTIREIYDVAVGKVNGHILQRNTELVCLIVAYAVKQRPIAQDVKLSDQKRFRWRFENLVAREIISQSAKNARMIEDELLDRKYIRSLRRRNIVKYHSSGEGDLHKIDFSKITVEGYEKVCAIANFPHKYRDHIDANDEILSKNYLLFFFGQIGDEIYSRSWAHVLIGLGLKPTNRGIEYLAKKIDQKMQDTLYECLVEQRVISPIDAIHMRFCQELYAIIKEVLDEKKIVKAREETDLWDNQSVLYVYKGQTSCHTRHHPMESATAVLTGRKNSVIKLNVEYCPQCKKFFISYTVYESYREKYGMILGKLRMDSNSTRECADVLLSEFSPLNLCGYSVSQQVGYSIQERQYLISKVIELGVLQKSEVIRYLEYFINVNGRKIGNEIALSKWKQDLEFALKYRLPDQNEYEIRYIKKY